MLVCPVAIIAPKPSATSPDSGRGRNEEPSVVDLVGEDAGRRSEEEHRQELQRHDDAELVAAVGEIENEPGDGERLRPRADARDDLADEVAPEVPGTEGGEPRRIGHVLSSCLLVSCCAHLNLLQRRCAGCGGHHNFRCWFWESDVELGDDSGLGDHERAH